MHIESFTIQNFVDFNHLDHIPEDLFYENFVHEVPIQIKTTRLDFEILKLMISGTDLIKSVFALIDFESLKDEVQSISTFVPQIQSDKEQAQLNYQEVSENLQKRQQWKLDREQVNIKRVEKKLEPLSLSEVDLFYPKKSLNEKSGSFANIYKSISQIDALKSTLNDEKLKT